MESNVVTKVLVISKRLEPQKWDRLQLKENLNAQSWKKRKLKFDEYYEKYEIMRDVSTNRCPYIYEQDRKT